MVLEFGKSDAYFIMRENTNKAVLVGGNCFDLSPCSMKPFKNPNYKSFTTRRKTSFLIFQHKIRIATSEVPTLLLICFILHKLPKILRDEYIPVSEEKGKVCESNLQIGNEKMEIFSN